MLSEIFLKKTPTAFVQMGSSGEYGSLQSPQRENSKCNPQSVYSRAKLLSSMHLIDLSVNFMGTSAIVGNSIPVGVGLGMSAKTKKTKQQVIARKESPR